jgi:hypothetical protein
LSFEKKVAIVCFFLEPACGRLPDFPNNSDAELKYYQVVAAGISSALMPALLLLLTVL